MAEYMLSQGTTTWYPTTSTASEQLLAEVAGRKLDYPTGAYMPGFHFEGPYINPKYKGAQDPLYIKTPNLEFIKSLPQVKRISIAPELPGSKNFIENCGILVSICHTDCDYETALGAFRAGATSLTHTYNAMPGIHHRAPGPIGAASDTEGVYAELISDGHHVHPSAIRILIKMC
jgi:N-acetylglucosamine-6-phosphate deacetylase